MRTGSTLLGLLLIFGMFLYVAPTRALNGGRPHPLEESAVVRRFKALGHLEGHAFVRELGVKRDLAALAEIYKSGLPGCSYAAAISEMLVDDDKAVRFCMQFPVGSDNWRAAFCVLDTHPKEFVIGYVKQIAASESTDCRVICYRLCLRRGWPDVVSRAKMDTSDPTVLLQVNGPLFQETVGMIARRYIDFIEQQELPAR